MVFHSMLKIIAFLVLTFVLSLLLSPFMNVLLYEAFHLLRGLGIPGRFLNDYQITGRLDEWRVNHFSIVPALLFASWLITRWEHRPLVSLGLSPHPRRWAKEFGLGALLALLYAVPVASLLLLFAPYLPITTPPGGMGPESLGAYISTPVGWIIIGITILLGAVGEELVFRGYPFQTLLTTVGKWPSILIVSSIFAILHFRTHGISAIVAAGLLGLLMAVLYLQSRSLWVAIGFHATVNAVSYAIPVKGGEENWLYAGATAGMTLLLAWWTLRHIKPCSEMESLWQKYVSVAQPWAQLKAWWIRRKNPAQGQTPPPSSGLAAP